MSTRVILIFILLLGLFFRVYKLEIFYPWGHDQDLFAWIAKDIIIDHHFRLIGQETSITGMFIGPIFYYMIALSFAIFNMNPLSASILTTIISLFTIFSIYWIFNKFFGKNVGLIGSFLYAISPGAVFLDRWVVPTQPTILWSVWFLYILLSILKGNFQILIPLSILIGLIWHIHIAFIPLLILLPIAFLLSDKRNYRFNFSTKTIIISLLILLVLTIPFFTFEIRHGFGQTKSLISATLTQHDQLTGVDRLIKVLDSSGRSLTGAFLLSGPVTLLNPNFVPFLPVLLLIIIFYLMFSKRLTKNQTILLTIWFLIVILGQFFSKRIITEYYFNNLFIILFLTFSLMLTQLELFFKKIPAVVILLVIYLGVVTVWFINKGDDLGGFLYKKKAIEFIKNYSVSKNYPCVAINHIESSPGGATGFRYLFWYYGLSLITPGNDVATFSIVNPWTISSAEISVKYGNLGVILPSGTNITTDVCTKPERQLWPLWGFNS